MALQKLCFRVIPTASRKMSSLPTNSNKPYTVIVEGNIGSGKTTFLQPFMKHKNLVEVCPEPVDKWRNLQVSSTYRHKLVSSALLVNFYSMYSV